MPMQPSGQVALLGDLDLRVESKAVALPRSRKSRAVFAYIAAAERPVPRSKLCDLFFSTTANPKGNLRWSLSRLRKKLKNGSYDLLCSDSKRVWLNQDRVEVDVHRLEKLLSADSLSVRDIDFLTDKNIHPFLADLDVGASADFQAWRATSQVHYDQTREQILESHIKSSMGSLEAIRLAHLLTEQAPHSEKAWYLLVEALREAKQDEEAKAFLKIARDRLNAGRVMQEGLLALVGGKLKLGSRVDIVDADRVNPVSSQKLRLLVFPTEGDSELTGAVFPSVFTSAASNKSFDTFSYEKEADDLFGTEFVLQTILNNEDDGVRLDAFLVENEHKRCVCSWSRSFTAIQPGELSKRVQSWLSIRFEMDINLCLVERAASQPESARTAQDFFYLALPEIYSPVGYSVQSALDKLRTALRLDANFGLALCLAAWVKSTHPQYNQAKGSRREIAAMARRSLELDYSNPLVLSWSAITLGHIEGNPEVGLAFAKRAKSLNSFSPAANLAMAILTHYTGDYASSLAYLDEVKGEDVEPITFMFQSWYAMNYFQLGETQKAIESARQSVVRNPGYIVGLRVLTASLSQNGDIDEASKFAKKMLELDESDYLDHLSQYLPYIDRAPLDLLFERLAQAGLPKSAVAN